MTKQDINTLKGYFNTGDVPSEQNFADLIDTLYTSATSPDQILVYHVDGSPIDAFTNVYDASLVAVDGDIIVIGKPGEYPESIIIPAGVTIVGLGDKTTITGSIYVSGDLRISYLRDLAIRVTGTGLQAAVISEDGGAIEIYNCFLSGNSTDAEGYGCYVTNGSISVFGGRAWGSTERFFGRTYYDVSPILTPAITWLDRSIPEGYFGLTPAGLETGVRTVTNNVDYVTVLVETTALNDLISTNIHTEITEPISSSTIAGKSVVKFAVSFDSWASAREGAYLSTVMGYTFSDGSYETSSVFYSTTPGTGVTIFEVPVSNDNLGKTITDVGLCFTGAGVNPSISIHEVVLENFLSASMSAGMFTYGVEGGISSNEVPFLGDRSAYDALNFRLRHANDIDDSDQSIHHTLGTAWNQAAPGDHTHEGTGPTNDYICFQDQKTSGTPGGAFAPDLWVTRELNTVIANNGDHAVLATNQVTLQPGTYIFHGSAVAYQVEEHQTRLQNITDNVTVNYGICSYAWTAGHDASVVNGQFSITVETIFELQHRCASDSLSNTGRGNSTGWGTEVYANLEFWKVA